MAFRRVRRLYMQARKARKVRPVIEELLQAIEGNGMCISAWFGLMDDLAVNNMVTQTELSKGMQILQSQSHGRKKQPVLTTDQVGWMHFCDNLESIESLFNEGIGWRQHPDELAQYFLSYNIARWRIPLPAKSCCWWYTPQVFF